MTIITGSNNADTRNDTGGNDIIRTFAGDDIIYVSSGSDIVDGGPGNDTVNLGGLQQYYTITRSGSSVFLSEDDYSQIRLINIETVHFGTGGNLPSTLQLSTLPVQDSTFTVKTGFAAFTALFADTDIGDTLLGSDMTPFNTIKNDIDAGDFLFKQVSGTQVIFQNGAGFLVIQGSGLSYTGALNDKVDINKFSGKVSSASIYTGGSYSAGGITGGTVAGTVTLSSTQITATLGADQMILDGANLPTDFGTVMSIVNGTYAGSVLTIYDIKLLKSGVQDASVTLSSGHVTLKALGYTLDFTGAFTTALTADILNGNANPTFGATGLTIVKDSTSALVASISGLTTPVQLFGGNSDPLSDFFSTISTVNASTSQDNNVFNLALGITDEDLDGFGLSGLPFINTVLGGSGSDTVTFGASNQYFDGGAGTDIANFAGPRSSFVIARTATGWTVNPLNAIGFTTLVNVEKAQFLDMTVNLNITPHDLSGDGKADLTWQNTDGTAVIYLMNGGTVASAAGLGNPGAAWKIKSTDDLNGDGKADLVWQNTDGTAVVYLMNGGAVSSIAGLGNPGAAWRIKATGDLNGDGKSDIVWQNTDGTGVVYFMNGGTIASVAGLGNPGSSWNIRATGDFNGDGKSDILWQNSDGTVVSWLMSGSFVMSATGVGNPGTAWHIRDTADFNGDGKSDILWQNDDGTTVIWFMNGATVTSAGGVGNAGSAWHIAGTGDINGDGKADITWQNDDGTTTVWLMNGATVAGYAGLGNPGSSWHVVTG